MKQWEMGRSQTPLPPERRAEVPWLFIRQQTGGVSGANALSE